MPSSMFDPVVHGCSRSALFRSSPDAPRRWGRKTCRPQMVCHLIDQLRIALGELPTRPYGCHPISPLKQS